MTWPTSTIGGSEVLPSYGAPPVGIPHVTVVNSGTLLEQTDRVEEPKRNPAGAAHHQFISAMSARQGSNH